MKYIAQVISALWQFITFMVKVCLLTAVVVLILSIIMPDNALKVVEIIKGLTG
jgi:hypothetical protein